MVRRKSTSSKNLNLDKHNTTEGRRRFKSGTVALREIKKLQKSVEYLIPRASFCRVVKEVIIQHSPRIDMRIQGMALQALQEAAEYYMTSLFEEAVLCMIHGKRVTLKVEDIRLVRRLRGVLDIGNW